MKLLKWLVFWPLVLFFKMMMVWTTVFICFIPLSMLVYMLSYH